MAPNTPLTLPTPKVLGVADADVDPEGHIPSNLLLTGIDVVVPVWPNPTQDENEPDTLKVIFRQVGQPLVEVENVYIPVDIEPEFIIHIGPEYLRVDGVGELKYEVYNFACNPAFSFPRQLTIDHTVVPFDLEEARFEHATKSGYLNCQTNPPLWEGVTVRIPPLTAFHVGDRCEVVWQGYLSPNGSGPPIVGTEKTIVRQALSAEDIREGFLLLIEPYETHIKPMVDDASATVVYSIYRGTKLVGRSKIGWVRIDRMIAGQELPCGP